LHFGTIAFEFDYAAFDNVDTLIHKNNVNLIIVGETLRYDHSSQRTKGGINSSTIRNLKVLPNMNWAKLPTC
jgi:hypothetical protein